MDWRLSTGMVLAFATATCLATLCSCSRAAGQPPQRSSQTAGTAEPPSKAAEAPTNDRLDWFTEARFGLFIHWAPVCLTGEEIGWSRGRITPPEVYDNLYLRFDPTEFDADAIAQLAVDAGMKYVVFTAKHHGGFCMWDSDTTDFDIMATPFARDVVAELEAACKARGLHFCLYYSILDWYHPHYTPQNMEMGGPGVALPEGVAPDMDTYVAYMKDQLEELITRYEPELIWFDGAWEPAWSDERGEDLAGFVRGLDADLVINNRAGRGYHAEVLAVGDYLTPEQKLGTFNHETPWETCMTIGTQWAWKPGDDLKSLTQCLHALIYCACGDGNFLFNVGPTERGVVEPRQADRLRAMGDWLDTYGESIYQTRGGPWRPGEWGGSTYRGDTIYLHILSWPEGGLVLPAYGQTITDARLLQGDAEVQWSQDEEGRVRVDLPTDARNDINTVVRLSVAQPVDRLAEPGGPVSLFEHDDRFGDIISRDATFTTSSSAHWDNTDHHGYLLDARTDKPEFAFHTLEEEHPWVMIDLGAVHEVTGVMIENRPGFEAKSAGLSVSISRDGENWEEVWLADKDAARTWIVPITRPHAGIDVPGRAARYLRLRVEREQPTYFHLRSVEVWGR